MVVQSDNAPQFTTAQFAVFSQEWDFQHTTSFPGHQQSNGKAEASVKIVKKIVGTLCGLAGILEGR